MHTEDSCNPDSQACPKWEKDTNAQKVQEFGQIERVRRVVFVPTPRAGGIAAGPAPAIPPQQPLVMNGRSGLTTSDDDTVLRILYIAGPCAFRH